MPVVRSLPALLLAAPLLLAGPGALAQAPQRAEIAPTVGWRTGGEFRDSATGATYDLEASSSWGAVANVSLGPPGLFLEVAWTRQESRVSFDDAFGPGLHDVTLDSLLVGGQWVSSPRSPVRPFLSALVGATRMDAPGSDTTRFTAALGAGLKLMANDTFGVRLEARALAIFGGSSAAGLCGGSGCTIGFTGWGSLQADLAAGAILAF
jgi:hypothetical protein